MAESAAGYLLAEEYLAAGDERFVATILTLHDPKRLIPLVDKWRRDHRPQVRAWVASYVDEGVKCHGHEPVVKRLFKQAEERRDDEQMAVFMVAFDRLVRRLVRTRHRYDWNTRSSWKEQYLYTPRNKLTPWTAKKSDARLFSAHTRSYLRRRVWRYFRRMAFQQPDQYRSAIALALVRYEDGFLGSGESLLDSWSLMHACFFECETIEFTASSTRLRAGQSLANLAAAPFLPELWKVAEAATLLLDILAQARSRAVRVWAIQLIRRDHLERLNRVPIEQVMALLDNVDPEVQTLGAQLLETSQLLPTLPLEMWLKMLQVKSLTALETISRLMRQHISPERVSFAQALELSLVAPTPVARLGFELLQKKSIGPGEVESLVRLAELRCTAVAHDSTKWAMTILGSPENYSADRVARFFDSLQEPARRAAWEWLVAFLPLPPGEGRGEGASRGRGIRPRTPPHPNPLPEGEGTRSNSRGYSDPELWSRLLESPFDDIKFNLVKELERRTNLPGADDRSLSRLWSNVLLGIHRGGRTKLIALRQISNAMLDHPNDAETLLPVLAVAIRSVRLPEARSGLASIVRTVEMRPELKPIVAKFLPELQIPDLEAIA